MKFTEITKEALRIRREERARIVSDPEYSLEDRYAQRVRERDDARREVVKLREALRAYGSHASSCHSRMGTGFVLYGGGGELKMGGCSCGYEKALAS